MTGSNDVTVQSLRNSQADLSIARRSKVDGIQGEQILACFRRCGLFLDLETLEDIIDGTRASGRGRNAKGGRSRTLTANKPAPNTRAGA